MSARLNGLIKPPHRANTFDEDFDLAEMISNPSAILDNIVQCPDFTVLKSPRLPRKTILKAYDDFTSVLPERYEIDHRNGASEKSRLFYSSDQCGSPMRLCQTSHSPNQPYHTCRVSPQPARLPSKFLLQKSPSCRYQADTQNLCSPNFHLMRVYVLYTPFRSAHKCFVLSASTLSLPCYVCSIDRSCVLKMIRSFPCIKLHLALLLRYRGSCPRTDFTAPPSFPFRLLSLRISSELRSLYPKTKCQSLPGRHGRSSKKISLWLPYGVLFPLLYAPYFCHLR